MFERFGKVLDFLRHRKRDYQLTFNTPTGKLVLQDLSNFCRGNETCVVPGDVYRTFVLEGRREVLLRITQHLTLTSQQLMVLYGGVPAKPDEGE